MLKKILQVLIKYLLLLLIMDCITYLLIMLFGKGILIAIVMQIVIASIIFMSHHGRIYDEKKNVDMDAFERVKIFYKYTSWTWKLLTTPTEGNKMIKEWKIEMIAYNCIYALVLPNIYMLLALSPI